PDHLPQNRGAPRRPDLGRVPAQRRSDFLLHLPGFMLKTKVFSRAPQTSSLARSHFPSRAPASYVLSRKAYKSSSGDSASRMSLYIRMNSDTWVFQRAASGRIAALSIPGGLGTTY